MRGVVVLSSVVSAIVSATFTATFLGAMVPSRAGAQATRMEGEAFILLAPDGTPAGRMVVTPYGTGQIQSLGTDGAVRVQMANGGPPSNPNPLNAGVDVNYPGQPSVTGARLGMDSGQPRVALRDRNNKLRFIAVLDDDGNPSIQFLDPAGNVTWSAP